MSAPSDAGIRRLTQTRWRSIYQGRLDQLDSFLSSKSDAQHFGGEYISRLSARIGRIQRAYYRLALINLTLVLALFVSRSSISVKVGVFGITTEDIQSVKEFVLFASALLGLSSTILSSQQAYVGALIKTVLNKSSSPGAAALRKEAYVDDFATSFMENIFVGQSPHRFTTSLVVAYLGLTVYAVVAVLVASGFVYFSVLADVLMHPSTSRWINLFVVGFAITAQLMALILYVLRIPLPYIDYSNSEKLTELEKNDPEAYKATLRVLGEESRKNETRIRLTLSIFGYVATYILITVFLSGMGTLQTTEFVVSGALGAVLAFIGSELLSPKIDTALMRRFFQRFPDPSDTGHIKPFKWTKRLSAFLVFALGALLGTAVSAILLLSSS